MLIKASSAIALSARRLTTAEFGELAKVPTAAEWLANLDNPRTRLAYKRDIADACNFLSINAPAQFRLVTRAHVLAWRGQLEQRNLSGATVRRKLAALTSLFDYLLDRNAIWGGNPVHGVKRPRIECNEGKPPSLGDHQAKALSMLLIQRASRACATGRYWQCCCTWDFDAGRQQG